MTEADALDKFTAEQGWDEKSVNNLLLEYIERQQSPEAFVDFLTQAAQSENDECEDEDGPFKQERDAADEAVERGDTEITYRGQTFDVSDHQNGWLYSYRNALVGNLEEVFEMIDKELDS